MRHGTLSKILSDSLTRAVQAISFNTSLVFCYDPRVCCHANRLVIVSQHDPRQQISDALTCPKV